MKVSLRKRMIAAAIATLLSAPAWTASVTADDPAKARTGAQSASETKSDTERSSATGNTERSSGTGDTERSSGTGTSQSGSATGTTSGSAGAGTSGSAGAGASGSAGAGTSASGSGSTSPSMGAGTAKADNPLYARTVDELKGTDVVDASGKEIGEIKKVVLTQDRRSAHAVVSVGGFLGIGDRNIVVSLDEFRAAGDDKLQLNATKEDLKARPKFESEQYVELEGDQPISGSITDFAAFETDRNRTMDKTMDKDKNMRQPSTGSGAAGTSSGTTGSGTTGKGTTQ